MAVESLEKLRFTVASDVVSFSYNLLQFRKLKAQENVVLLYGAILEFQSAPIFDHGDWKQAWMSARCSDLFSLVDVISVIVEWYSERLHRLAQFLEQNKNRKSRIWVNIYEGGKGFLREAWLSPEFIRDAWILQKGEVRWSKVWNFPF